MIVDAALAPEGGLVPEDIAPFVERVVFRTPEDATGVRVSRSLIGIEHPVIVPEGFPVIIPMAGHRKGIGDESTEIGVVEGHGV